MLCINYSILCLQFFILQSKSLHQLYQCMFSNTGSSMCTFCSNIGRNILSQCWYYYYRLFMSRMAHKPCGFNLSSRSLFPCSDSRHGRQAPDKKATKTVEFEPKRMILKPKKQIIMSYGTSDN